MVLIVIRIGNIFSHYGHYPLPPWSYGMVISKYTAIKIEASLTASHLHKKTKETRVQVYVISFLVL